MFIDIEKNPNCTKSGFFVFEELAEARPIWGVRGQEKGQEVEYDVTGVDAGGNFSQVYAQKISDSGSGIGFLIFGGTWGVRLKSRALAETWSLESKNQQGEAYMIYGDEKDIIFRE